ncbi:MAG: DPP IV N-terminal domain-containing protein, partial [Anaerolineae bacterium]|nr:DPP IV N-terminal domain-containing protein [Anaerolineae bacterium]
LSRSIAFVIPILLNLFVAGIETQAQAVANGKIAFVSNRSGQFQVYTIDPDGSNLRQLTFNSGSNWHPSWSGDGLQIAFVSDWANAKNDIFVMDADGSNIRNITNTPEVAEHAPVWSPDGEYIAYQRGRTGSAVGSELYVMNADGTHQSKVFGEDSETNIPSAWSPDSIRIAFASSRGDEPKPLYRTFFAFYQIHQDGTGQEPLGYGGLRLAPPDWSSDGDYFLYGDEFGMVVIAKIGADRSEDFIWLHHLGTNNGDPRWSPDGQQVVYQHDWNIYVGPVAEGEPLQLTHSEFTVSNIEPDWQPLPPFEVD